MRSLSLRARRGFTLVELMIVVAIIGVLAALAIYGVRKYLATAKSAEARNTIGAIQRGASQAYTRENTPSELNTAGGASSGTSQNLCGSSTLVPTTFANVTNKKYTPLPTGDYQATSAQNNALNGWKCLRFEMTQPQYYQYGYTKGATGNGTTLTLPAGAGWVSQAIGDLDGNGTKSEFALTGAVVSGIPITSTAIAELNPDE